MSRYWNGHQWKELPFEQRAEASSAVPATTAIETAAETTAAAPAEAQDTAEPRKPTVPTTAIVPTHAEYGDVFIAAAAAAEAS